MPVRRPTNRSRQPDVHPTASTPSPDLLLRFRHRLAAGDYDALIGRGLRRTLRGAAADTGLEAEIGALRLALVRLLIEEHDPTRMATGVARLAAVAVHAARVRHAPDTDLEEIRTGLMHALDDLERERALATGQDQEAFCLDTPDRTRAAPLGR